MHNVIGMALRISKLSHAVVRAKVAHTSAPVQMGQHFRLLSILSADYIYEVAPTLDSSITESKLGDVFCSVDSYVKQDDVLAIIETNKGPVEVTATLHGVITEIFLAEGDSVVSHQDMFTLKPCMLH